jgi:hypothetical protein
MRSHEYKMEQMNEIRTTNGSATSKRFRVMNHSNIVTTNHVGLAPFCIANLFMVTFLTG